MSDDKVISMADFIRTKDELEGKRYIEAELPLDQIEFIRDVMDMFLEEGSGNMYELFQAFVMLGDIVEPLTEYLEMEEYEDETE